MWEQFDFADAENDRDRRSGGFGRKRRRVAAGLPLGKSVGLYSASAMQS
jgi:hypothetical protein